VAAAGFLTCTVARASATEDYSVATFSATANFTNYLDTTSFDSYLNAVVMYMCGSFERTQTVRFFINDTNNKPPVGRIPNPDIRINLDTWISNQPINFLTEIEFTDLDFTPANAFLNLTSTSDLIRIDLRQRQSSRPFRHIYDLYLNPDATPGNYSITLDASDGVNPGSEKINVYLSDGIKLQATAVTTILLLCIVS
jgi:hypothetical protein